MSARHTIITASPRCEACSLNARDAFAQVRAAWTALIAAIRRWHEDRKTLQALAFLDERSRRDLGWPAAPDRCGR